MNHFLIANVVECVTTGTNPTLEEALMNDVEIPNGLYDIPIVLPIVTHIIRDNNGNGGLSNSDLNTAINKLGQYFEQLNISFYHKNNTYIDNSMWMDGNTANSQADIIRGTDNDPTAIDIYFLPSVISSSNFPNSATQGILVINGKAVTGSTLAHEMGHYLFVFHTFETMFGTHCVGSYECDVKGDLVCDTEFDNSIIGGWLNLQCEIDGKTNKDACGNNANPDYYNIMNYNTYSCRDEFTDGQKERMLKALIKYYPEYIYTSIVLTNEKVNTNLGGFLSVIEKAETIESGESVGLIPYEFYTVKTENERFGMDKHHNWNSENNKYGLTNYFEAIDEESNQKAKFQELKQSTINITIDGGTITGKGDLQFHDPWYLKSNGTQPDDYLTFTSPYKPNGKEGASEKGVFIDQDPQIQNVYYSVKVEEEQTIDYNGSKNLHFQNWSSTNADVVTPSNLVSGYYETPIVFRNTNSVVNANYKGTQFTNTSGTFNKNNQNKIVSLGGG